ncbi:hypothetical protein [Frankia sp. QA3]|nr:hypothetical protein [Frankia sp. QA3]EIV92031.1 hypothetical protein FraQA3DRAFT_1525 [Frankia sp. QA3]
MAYVAGEPALAVAPGGTGSIALAYGEDEPPTAGLAVDATQGR